MAIHLSIEESSEKTSKRKRDADRAVDVMMSAAIRKHNRMIAIRDCDPSTAIQKAQAFADYIASRTYEIQNVLAPYASYPSVADEINRSLDLLRNLGHHSHYFSYSGGLVVAFMPRNQLLYSSVYLGVALALSAKTVFLHPPMSCASVFQALYSLLDFSDWFPNIDARLETHRSFVERTKQDSQAFFFTGNPENAERLRRKVAPSALFVSSGSGHNPVVVSEDADLEAAAHSIARLCFHNQGQDCGAPNTILVDASCATRLVAILQDICLDIDRQSYTGRGPQNILASNTDQRYVASVLRYINRHKDILRYNSQHDLQSGMLRPAMFLNHLTDGPWYDEIFAPIIRLQIFNTPEQLKGYFLTSAYEKQSMYVTFFGKSDEHLINHYLHPHETRLYNIDLHETERGIYPYGGFGLGASSIWFGQCGIGTPILPHRELYKLLWRSAQNAPQALTSHFAGSHNSRERQWITSD